MTANLQMTTKQLATAFNVSERGIYNARKLNRLRPDLGDKVAAGEMSLNEALRIAEARPKATSYDRLVRAWNAATPADRQKLLLAAAGAP